VVISILYYVQSCKKEKIQSSLSKWIFFPSKYKNNYLDKGAYKGLLDFFLQLILKHFEFNILKEKRDINGNYLVLDINVDKINFTLVSIHGPNDDNPQFYENIKSIVEGLK
jgi:hypothetical protein